MAIDLRRILALTTPIDNLNFDYYNHQKGRYQNKIYNKFSKSTSLMEIEEEYPYGSKQFRKIIVRVTKIPVVETGIKKGDDYKKITFIDQIERKGMGFLYRFQNNYWIADNSSIYSGITDTVSVRRCNNYLKWKDENGIIYEEPVSLHPQIFYNTNFSKAGPVTLSGYMKMYIQRNERTVKIKPNMRFLLKGDYETENGGYTAIKVTGGGVRDFLNMYNSPINYNSVIELTVNEDYIDPGMDDLENGIAGANRNSYSISSNINFISGNVGESFDINATTIFNGSSEDQKRVIWYIENPEIADLQIANNHALVYLKSIGNTSLILTIENDPSTSLLIPIVCTENSTSINYVTEIKPYTTLIYEGNEQIYECFLYENGVINPLEGFEFSINTNIQDKNFVFTVISDNSFSIKNIKRSSGNIKVTCTNNFSSKSINITLGGVF